MIRFSVRLIFPPDKVPLPKATYSQLRSLQFIQSVNDNIVAKIFFYRLSEFMLSPRFPTRGFKSARKKRAIRKVRQRQKRNQANKGTRVWPILGIKIENDFKRIFAPVDFDIHHTTQRQHLLDFIRRMRVMLLQSEASVLLDFSLTRRLVASATLLFVAELDRCLRLLKPTQVVRCKLPPETDELSKNVRESLEQIGLLDRLGYDCASFDRSTYNETVKHWRYATGTRADEEPGDILDVYDGKITDAMMQGMQVGLGEAIINSIHHAYSQPRGDKCKPYKECRWWMFTQEIEGMLHVLVCDLGIGIRRSLPLRWGNNVFKMLQARGKNELDVASIRLALEIGKTSTGEEHRGLGLPQIWSAVEASVDSTVGIYSGYGFLGRSGGGKSDQHHQYKNSILGTLIAWKVPVLGISKSNGSENDRRSG